MFLIRVLLLPVPAVIALILLQPSSAFLPQLVSDSSRNHVDLSTQFTHHRNSRKLLPSKSSLNSLPSSTTSLFPIATTLTELLDTTTEITPVTQPPPVVVEGLSPTTNTIVFVLGLIPFIWATYEFWSRIAVGASFGTGADSIQIVPGASSDDSGGKVTIGEDGNLSKSRGRKVLGDDALAVAYVLFAIVIASVGITVYSVLSSPLPPM